MELCIRCLKMIVCDIYGYGLFTAPQWCQAEACQYQSVPV